MIGVYPPPQTLFAGSERKQPCESLFDLGTAHRPPATLVDDQQQGVANFLRTLQLDMKATKGLLESLDIGPNVRPVVQLPNLVAELDIRREKGIER